MDSMKIMDCLARTMETDVDTLLQMPPTSDLSKAGLESIKFIQFIVLLEEEMGITVRDSDLLVSNLAFPAPKSSCCSTPPPRCRCS